MTSKVIEVTLTARDEFAESLSTIGDTPLQINPRVLEAMIAIGAVWREYEKIIETIHTAFDELDRAVQEQRESES